MFRLLILMFICSVGCSRADQESGALNVAAENSESESVKALQLFKSTDASMLVNRNELLNLVRSGKSYFGYNIPALKEVVTDAFENLNFNSLVLKVQNRVLDFHFNAPMSFELTDGNTVEFARTVKISNWRIAEKEFYLFDAVGLSYNSQPVQTIRYSESYGIEVMTSGEFEEFDINPILEFYDRHEKNIDAFMLSLEKPVAKSNGAMVSDALDLFSWFSKTAGTNSARIDSDALSSMQGGNQNQNDVMNMVLNRTVGVEVRPGVISAQLLNNRGLSMKLDDKQVYLSNRWSLIHESSNSVRIQGLMVMQNRIFRDDLWHPIYHARVFGESMTVTAWVKPGPLLRARNISTQMRL